MFYDANRRKPGYICGPDFLAIDEVKLVNFGDENEMRSILQGYLEYGTFNANGYNGESDAGVVFLGNIKEEKMNEYEYMLGELPTLFQETALLDRIQMMPTLETQKQSRKSQLLTLNFFSQMFSRKWMLIRQSLETIALFLQ